MYIIHIFFLSFCRCRTRSTAVQSTCCFLLRSSLLKTKIRFHCQQKTTKPANNLSHLAMAARLTGFLRNYIEGARKPAHSQLRWELPQVSSHLGVSGGHYLPNKDCQCLTGVFHNLLSKVSLRMFCARTGLISCFRKAITATRGRCFGATGKVSSRSKAKRSFTKWKYPNSAAILILHC